MSLPFKVGDVLLCVEGTEDAPRLSIAHGLLTTGEIYIAADVPPSLREFFTKHRTRMVRVRDATGIVGHGRVHMWEPERFVLLGSVAKRPSSSPSESGVRG
jgi:hypothetical protein